ncbi:MAG: restriction endonuclease subunit S [Desulfovibrio sp.]|uniref:restriction endonuclease subunit S n=1 Tax=Desulfovibrio sp. TaxID=885 RepID=UPI00135EB446|nr:restriction endonuclease subunit S [Desulfovibrio sp.]MTJ93770.1 restriction endonuclease subunit S [Desulfovibrio sp.]
MSGAGKRWKPYPTYKDSGAEWLGEVPEGWAVKRLKFGVDDINQKCLEEAPLTPFVALEHIEPWTGKLMVDESSQSDGQPSCYQSDDVLFCKLRPYLAKVHLAKVNGICTSELLVLRAQHGIFPKYLHRFLLSRDTIDCITASTYGAKMPRANWEFIGNLLLPIPPLPEQRAIAAFLDQQCAQIDSLIEKKQRMLDLLDEKRRAVITQAVTRGLDPTVPMKNSGVEWLGMVPEGWEIFSLRRLFCVKSGDMTTSTDLFDEGFQVFGGNGFRGYFDKWNTNKGVIIIGRYGALCGNIKISPDRIWATEHAFRVVPFMVFNVHFMAFFLEHLNLNRLSTRAAQPGLNSEMVRNHLIALPPLPEQQAIADYLDAQCAAMDSQRENLEKSIELLREYRASLITHAVTGKIDVRDVAPLQ